MGSESIRYAILDPTGNLTALVEDPVPPVRQPAVAAQLMRLHPAVEQVGFVRPAAAEDGPVDFALRMAGGEFCGNAAMSAAALWAVRRGPSALPTQTLSLRVSGAAQPVRVRLQSTGEGTAFRGGVCMPPALEIARRDFVHGTVRGRLPLVRMEGISHVIVERSSPFFALKADRAAAERAVRDWCAALGCDGLGLMFLDGETGAHRLTPLVYVPAGETVFWENSCASGSAAAGMYLADRLKTAVRLSLREPGGILTVDCDPASGETWLWGQVRLEKSCNT